VHWAFHAPGDLQPIQRDAVGFMVSAAAHCPVLHAGLG
jgi:hypothetical protein